MRRTGEGLFFPDAVFLPQPVEIIAVAILGLMLGSFATALAYRAERGIPWWRKGDRSGCPRCGKTLSLKDLIPLFSWLALKGRCRHCGGPVSPLYPATELALMMLCLLYYGLYGGLVAPGGIVPVFLVLPFLWALMIVDLRLKILPDSLVLVVAVLGLFRLAFRMIEGGGDAAGLALDALGGAPVYGGLAWVAGRVVGRLTGKAALGFGDVKFFAVAGLWLGVSALGDFCLAAGVAGISLGLLWRKMTGEERFPFGPALILAFCVLLALGSPLLAP